MTSVVLQVVDSPNGAVAWITLNRPQVLNALNLDLVTELDAVTAQVAENQEIKVVVVRGAGRAFSSGLDIAMMAREGMPDGFYARQESAFLRLERMEKITIAAVHGHCLGGGVQLAIACDLRIVSSSSSFGLPAIYEGLFPGLAPFRLPRLIGLGPARWLILSGEVINPDKSLQLGLIDKILPAQHWDSALHEVVTTFTQTPHLAAVSAKKLMELAYTSDVETAYLASLPLLAQCLAEPETAIAAKKWRKRRRNQNNTMQ
jgi:enoyl-CoA hydratase